MTSAGFPGALVCDWGHDWGFSTPSHVFGGARRVNLIEDDGSHVSMMSWRMMFCKVVSNVVGARCPINAEVALGDAIPYPIEAHVDGFGADLFDGPVHDATGSGVVGFYWCGGLWVSHFAERVANYSAFFGVEEEGTDFGFGGACHDAADDFGNVEDGAIEHRWTAGEISKVVMAARAAASFRFGKVGRVAVDM